MASLKKRRTKWYARVRWYDNNGRRYENQIPLLTKDKATARIRLSEVSRNEKDLRDGIDVEFAWQNKEGETKIVEYSLESAVEEYLSYLRSNGRRNSTIERANIVLNNFMSALGKTFPVKNIKSVDIERYKSLFADKRKGQGLNVELTRIRAFVNWAYDIKDMMDKRPKVTMVKVSKQNPKYLTESDLKKMQEMDGLDAHFKEAFTMYYQTGMRLREPFDGEIDGYWIEVKGEDSKSGIPREINLNDFHLKVILEMKARYLTKPDQPHRVKTGYYSKVFKKVVRALGKPHLKFHNLRDTFAVMRYLEKRDIYLVSKELGHSTVKVTEKYARMSIRKIEEDFPTLAKNYTCRNIPKSLKGDTLLGDTNLFSSKYLDEGKA